MGYTDNVVDFPTSLPEPKPNMFIAITGFVVVAAFMVTLVVLALTHVPNWFVDTTKMSYDTLQIAVMAVVGPVAANILIVVYAQWWKYVCHRA